MANATAAGYKFNEENAARQEEELESLRLIYTEDLVRELPSSSPTGQAAERIVEVKLGQTKEQEEEGRAGGVVTLRVYLSPTYPGGDGAAGVAVTGEEENEMPCFEVRNLNWRKHDQNALIDGMKELFEAAAGEVVIFSWCEWLKEELHLQPLRHTTALEEEEDDGGHEEQEEQQQQHRQRQSEISTSSSTLTPQEAAKLHNLNLIHGVPCTERKSTFQAHLARITTEEDAKTIVNCLLLDKKIQRATHNMYAFRVWDVKKQAQVNDNDDDGEAAAGGKLAELLHFMDANNVIVVVSRWWGGILLGPSRFRVINNTARQLLEECGFDGKGGGGGSGGGSSTEKKQSGGKSGSTFSSSSKR